MQFQQLFFLIFMLFVINSNVCESQNCATPLKTITVDQSNNADFKTIQSAIDSISEQNSQWIHIQIASGVYRERVVIPMNKPCIFLQGEGNKSTSIEWGEAHPNATFHSKANNTIAMDITFTNTRNSPVFWDEYIPIIQAVAARIHADKCAFFNCAFLGVQDTLYDDYGRHYYHNCYIQGGIDFIYGSGQSIFEASEIHFSMGKNPKMNGIFTAQERESADDTSGFVFKNCNITGDGEGGQAILGRALTAYSRVIIANSSLSNVVTPMGWSARSYVGHEETITYVEEGNTGPGANQSERVKWMKHLNRDELDHFLNISFIDDEGWIAKLPLKI